MPEWIDPQLATLVDDVPAGDDWIHEIKYDGYRILAFVEDGRARLVSRNGKDWTAAFPAVASAAARIAVESAVLDGEVVVLDPEGRSSFQLLQNALTGSPTGQLCYMVFDLPYLDGRDLRAIPLERRKEALRSILPSKGGIAFSDHVEGLGHAFYRHACSYRLEGVISKKRDGPYRGGRSRDWLKTKCSLRQEFVIAGWTDPEGARLAFGALLLGWYDQAKLVYCGKVGTGFTEETLNSLHRMLKPLEVARPALANPPRGKGVHWAKPRLVCEVRFSGWTDDGILRAPSFQGLREDKKPRDVVREQPARAPRASVRLTNPERILYPEEGITKRQLALYYESIADRMLPHVAGRPLTIVRCPEGHTRECFYQKQAKEDRPPAVKRVDVDGQPYMFIDSVDGLISLVQMGVLEIHPWGSRVEDLEHPDRVTFDLDPSPEVTLEALSRAAAEVKRLLESIGLRSFLKTTGGKGLHVVVPVLPEHDWDEVKAFARAIALELERFDPSRFTSALAKSARRGKIFVDYLRNQRDATAIAVWSTRARSGAPIAVPLDWSDLGRVRPDRYSVLDLPSRARDPWEEIGSVRQSLAAVFTKGKP